MPSLQFSERIQNRLALAVLLRDAFTGLPSLLGEVEALVAGIETGMRKPLESTFLFLKLGAGTHFVQIRSLEQPPLYLPVDLSVTMPPTDSLWPAVPDRALANRDIPFDSPAQPAAFRVQFQQTSLLPSTAYPFPGDATLIRGTVSSNGTALKQAVVSFAGEKRYVTGDDGEYVVFLTRYSPAVSLTFEKPGFNDVVPSIDVRPRETTLANISMTP